MGFFSKKKEEKRKPLPYIYGIIDFTESAKREGILIDLNKEVRIYKQKTPDQEPDEVYPYNKKIVKVLEHVRGIPIIDMSNSKIYEVRETVNPAMLEKESVE